MFKGSVAIYKLLILDALYLDLGDGMSRNLLRLIAVSQSTPLQKLPGASFGGQLPLYHHSKYISLV